jgi:catechol 2,3-dioxygenase-like lactoylglutathione lyase family enzyme
MIRRLHHNAYRCRDSEETRRFYEEFLGLPLAGTLEIKETKSGRKTKTLHTFYELDEGEYLAFFEAPDTPFEFKPQHDFDLHIALEMDERRSTTCWRRVARVESNRAAFPTTASFIRFTSAIRTAT